MAGDLITGYARALLQVASAEGQLDRVTDELFRFAKVLEQNYELRSALTDIAVPDERKQAVLDEILGAQASPHTRNLIGFVVSQGRTRELPEIVESLNSLAAQERNRVVAEVRSATDLDEEQQQRLSAALGRATGKDVDVKVVIDPSILGGIYAKVGDQVIDGTVRRRLEELSTRLTQR
ncbi:MAG TPA: ATP synthase F1 subunit delta [Actinomycetota bacterium]|nr:ATP synthase F1 subunit delta [Actinomycetota bacterium]